MPTNATTNMHTMQGASLTVCNAQGNTAAEVARLAGRRSVYQYLTSIPGNAGGETEAKGETGAAQRSMEKVEGTADM